MAGSSAHGIMSDLFKLPYLVPARCTSLLKDPGERNRVSELHENTQWGDRGEGKYEHSPTIIAIPEGIARRIFLML